MAHNYKLLTKKVENIVECGFNNLLDYEVINSGQFIAVKVIFPIYLSSL